MRVRKVVEGKVLLKFALDVYFWQLRRGRYFVHEHPATATSWKLPDVQRLSREMGVECIVNDACMFGMMAKGADGTVGPARKPTRWMTNAPYLARNLNRKCRGTHQAHVHLVGGRAAQAAVYPPALVEAIVRGLQIQREHDHRAGRAESPLDLNILQAMDLNEAEAETGTPENMHINAIKEAYDESTGELLDERLVRKAKLEELAYFKSKGVWRVVLRARAKGQRVVGTRWVNCNGRRRAT